MFAYSVSDLTVSIDHTILLENISFGLNSRSRLGIVGVNGSGKSSLLKILAGKVPPMLGKICHPQEMRLAYVEQFLPKELTTLSVFEALEEKSPKRGQGAEYDYLVERMLSRFGFGEDQIFNPLTTLSGGELNRLQLARALMSEPDILLLDEPTNHLDHEAALQMRELLSQKVRCGLVIVSHDRALLDLVTDSTLFLRGKRAQFISSPYSKAKSILEAMEQAALEKSAREKKEITRLEKSARRLAIWGKEFDNEKLSSRAKNMEKRVEKKKEQLSYAYAHRVAQISLDARALDADILIRWAEGSIQKPNGQELFLFENFIVKPGDKIALLGLNGCGKSTFLNNLFGKINRNAQPERGLSVRDKLRCSYYDQKLDLLPKENTLFEYIREAFQQPDQCLRSKLIKAGFPITRHNDKLSVFSGGELARIRLLEMALRQPELTLLDEPTNHIDIEGIEQLEMELQRPEVSCLFVSHDQKFIEKVANRRFLIEGGVMQEQ